jgi:hypothetical protein
MKTLFTITLLLISLSLRSGTLVYSAPAETGLVGYWKMDEGGLTSVIDYSGNGNVGTNVGGAVLTNGVNGSALSFNGVNQYVKTPFQGYYSNLTVCCWFNGTTNQNCELVEKSPVNSTWSLLMEVRPGLEFRVNNFTLSTNVNINSGWHFICASQAGSTSSIYADGTIIKTGVTTTIPASTNSVYIGCYDGAGYFLSGSIDDVRIYNRTLSPAEITNLYNFRSQFYKTNGISGYKP